MAAGLELAGVHVAASDRLAKDRYLRSFSKDEIRSKPIGFYTWNDDLKACFRFLRFFQKEFKPDDIPNEMAIPQTLGKVIAADPTLLADYHKAVGFYAPLDEPQHLPAGG